MVFRQTLLTYVEVLDRVTLRLSLYLFTICSYQEMVDCSGSILMSHVKQNWIALVALKPSHFRLEWAAYFFPLGESILTGVPQAKIDSRRAHRNDHNSKTNFSHVFTRNISF